MKRITARWLKRIKLLGKNGAPRVFRFSKDSERQPVEKTISHEGSRVKRPPSKIAKILPAYMVFSLSFFGLIYAGPLRSYLNDKRMQTTEFRKKFTELYRVQLSGWKEDVEKNPLLANDLLYGLRSEMLASPFKLDEIRFMPEEFFRRNFQDHLIRRNDIEVAWTVDRKKIVFSRKANSDVIRHEMKHVRIYQGGPKLIEEWEKLFHRITGKILWNTHAVGFVSNYAATSVHEDIAELCTLAEEHPELMYQLMSEYKGTKLFQKKLLLAQKYHLIPPETTDFIEYAGRIRPTFMESFDGDTRDYARVYSLSLGFLSKHPTSVYAPRIYANMASVTKNNLLRKRLTIKVLEYPHDKHIYELALLHLIQITPPDSSQQAIFIEAKKLYGKRYNEVDPLLPFQGVNDFLREKGVMK